MGLREELNPPISRFWSKAPGSINRMFIVPISVGPEVRLLKAKCQELLTGDGYHKV